MLLRSIALAAVCTALLGATCADAQGALPKISTTIGQTSTTGSSSITTGGTAQALWGSTTPSNGWKVENLGAVVSGAPLTNACYVSDEVTAPASGVAGSHVVYAGGQYATEPTEKPVGPVYLNCPNTGQAFSARRW